jgi:bifunctional enzyme CysN/CysC
MCKHHDLQPKIASQFKASLFWLGKTPMQPGKKYKIKLATHRGTAYLKEIISVLNAAELSQTQKKEIDRHEVAHVVIETLKPIAFDLASDLAQTGRFVIIDDYEIAGGGIITEALSSAASMVEDFIAIRDHAWEKSDIPTEKRAEKLQQTAQFILITGDIQSGKSALAKALETELFSLNKTVYYMGISNLLGEIGSPSAGMDREEQLKKLGLTAHMFTQAGLILISTLPHLDDTEAKLLKTLVSPHATTLISIGEPSLVSEPADCILPKNGTKEDALAQLRQLLAKKGIVPEYYL